MGLENKPDVMGVIRIGVLDNDPFALDAMCAMIAAMSRDFRVVWSTGSPAVAIEHCHNAHTRPDVLVLDMALGGITGADVCRRIRRRTSAVGIVCVTSYSTDVYRAEAIAAGAQGLLAKERLSADIVDAVRQAASGEPTAVQAAAGFRDAVSAYALLSGTVPARMSEDMKDSLSAREKDILRLYSQRLTTDEIAQRLGITKGSVFTYVHRAADKLGVTSRREVLEACARYDLL
ncbi:response regulator [Bifidobacterium cebidarum]|nr:response regulator transcription factor [Bifidobacterium cebidarum]